jgi:hypothetical protein
MHLVNNIVVELSVQTTVSKNVAANKRRVKKSLQKARHDCKDTHLTAGPWHPMILPQLRKRHFPSDQLLPPGKLGRMSENILQERSMDRIP